MNNTTENKRSKRIAKLIDMLREAQAMADSMNLVNGGGGEIGGLIGSIADELEVTQSIKPEFYGDKA